MEYKPYFVGISGGSASGKTLFLNSLKERFGSDDICIVSQDNYYKQIYEHQRDENGHINYDLPDCVDLDSFADDISALNSGKSIQRHEYRFQHEDQKGNLLTFKPAPIIVCEGLFVFSHSRLFNQFDLKLFISTDEDIALQRRIKRDMAERNISKDFVLYQWRNHVIPAYTKFLHPFMAKADIIINNNTNFENSLKLVSVYLEKIVETKKLASSN